MKIRKFLLTALAIGSFSMATMAQERHDRPGGPDREHFVKEAPRGSREVVYKDVHYHYADGKFYRPHQQGGFEIVAPPVGIEVNTLPRGYAIKKHNGVNYYYKDNVCYKRGPGKNTWVIVKRPW